MSKNTSPTKGEKFAGYLFVEYLGWSSGNIGIERPYIKFEEGGSGEKLLWFIGDRKGKSADAIAAELKPLVGTTDPVWVEAFLYNQYPNEPRTMRRVTVTL